MSVELIRTHEEQSIAEPMSFSAPGAEGSVTLVDLAGSEHRIDAELLQAPCSRV